MAISDRRPRDYQTGAATSGRALSNVGQAGRFPERIAGKLLAPFDSDGAPDRPKRHDAAVQGDKDAV